MTDRLSSSEFFEQLEFLNLVIRRMLAGERKGEHFSLKSGGTVEFSDHRAYTPGDDLRYLDWKVFARHGELFIKEFAAEEDAHVLLILDGSRSMDFGSPNRFFFARKLCAALAYIALAQFDTCSVLSLGQNTTFLLREARGKRQIYPLLDRLDQSVADAKTAFDSPGVLDALRSRQNTTAILLSDFYDREAIRSYLRKLRAMRIRSYSIHIMTPDELHPDLQGATELVDQETGEALQLDVDERTLEAYQAALQEHLDRIQSLCLRYGDGYARMSSTTSLVPGVIQLLQTHQMLR
jgi:uncharacterized protein (DUF58 family)